MTWNIKEEEVERIKETENDEGGSIMKHCLLDMTWLLYSDQARRNSVIDKVYDLYSPFPTSS